MHIRIYLYYEIRGSKKILFTRNVDKKKNQKRNGILYFEK